MRRRSTGTRRRVLISVPSPRPTSVREIRHRSLNLYVRRHPQRRIRRTPRPLQPRTSAPISSLFTPLSRPLIIIPPIKHNPPHMPPPHQTGRNNPRRDPLVLVPLPAWRYGRVGREVRVVGVHVAERPQRHLGCMGGAGGDVVDLQWCTEIRRGIVRQLRLSRRRVRNGARQIWSEVRFVRYSGLGAELRRQPCSSTRTWISMWSVCTSRDSPPHRERALHAPRPSSRRRR